MADLHATEKTLEREIAPAVERSVPGVEVLAVELVSPTRFCVFVDHPGGVDHALCERVSSVLGDYLDRYAIDVSSPGFERPLRKPAHFKQVLGRRVALRTSGKIAGSTKFRGELVAADERTVTVAPEPGVAVEIPYDALVRGNLIDEG
ncbi:MAG: ribosome maturation factor RimP [Gaiellaceae bacterium]